MTKVDTRNSEIVDPLRATVRFLLMPLTLTFLIALAFISEAQGALTNLADATNKAGMQRMLTQRMLMDYALIGQNIKYKDPHADIKKTVDLFDLNLKEIVAYTTDPATRKFLTEIQSLWNSTKPKLLDNPKHAVVAGLQKNLEQILTLSHEVTQILAKIPGNNAGLEVNISGRQRMLSQRLASLYMLRSWRVEGLKFETEFKTTLQEFKQNQEKLEQSSLTTPEIQKQLVIAAKAILWFDMSAKSKSGSFIPSLILRSSNKILAAMDKATTLYAKK